MFRHVFALEFALSPTNFKNFFFIFFSRIFVFLYFFAKVLEVARMFSLLYAEPSSHAGHTLMFILTTAGRFLYILLFRVCPLAYMIIAF